MCGPRTSGIDFAFNPLGGLGESITGGSSDELEALNVAVDPGGLLTSQTVTELDFGGPLGGVDKSVAPDEPPDLPGVAQLEEVESVRGEELSRLSSAMGFASTIKTSGQGVTKRADVGRTKLKGSRNGR